MSLQYTLAADTQDRLRSAESKEETGMGFILAFKMAGCRAVLLLTASSDWLVGRPPIVAPWRSVVEVLKRGKEGTCGHKTNWIVLFCGSWRGMKGRRHFCLEPHCK